MTRKEEEMRQVLERVWEMLHEGTEDDKTSLSYGCVQRYQDGTSLWYEPISDTADGFVLRKGQRFGSQYSEARGQYILGQDDPSVIAVYERKEGRR